MSGRLIDNFATTAGLADAFSDAAVLNAMLRFESALARSQARLGMIPPHAAESFPEAAEFDAAALLEEARQSASLAIPFVKALRKRVEWAHWGATSQDLLDTAMVLLLRDARPMQARDHVRLTDTLRSLAEQHSGTMMLSRTLLQPAPPITFGYKAAGWLAAMDRNWKRFSAAFDEALQLQFGGAAGTLAAFGNRGLELARELAKELELPVPDAPWHAHRDRLASLVAQCGVYCGSVAKIATDIALLMQAEIGEVAERGGGSSAMPNKRNPAGSVVALAAAGCVPGLVAAFLSAMPQEHERAAGGWQSEWPVIVGVVQATGSALAAVADAVAGLTVNVDRMRANLEATGGSVFAERAVMVLAPEMGRSAAESLVAEAGAGKPLREVLAPRVTPVQIDAIDRPEDYLGMAEAFRLRLLKNSE